MEIPKETKCKTLEVRSTRMEKGSSCEPNEKTGGVAARDRAEFKRENRGRRRTILRRPGEHLIKRT